MGAREEFNQTKNSDDLCVWATTWAEKLMYANDKLLKLVELTARQYMFLVNEAMDERTTLRELRNSIVDAPFSKHFVAELKETIATLRNQ